MVKKKEVGVVKWEDRPHRGRRSQYYREKTMSFPPGLVDPPLQSSMAIHEFSSASTCLNGTIPAGDVYEDFCHSAESARSQTSFREQQVEVCQDFDPSRLPSSTSLKDSCLNGTIPARNTYHCQG